MTLDINEMRKLDQAEAAKAKAKVAKASQSTSEGTAFVQNLQRQAGASAKEQTRNTPGFQADVIKTPKSTLPPPKKKEPTLLKLAKKVKAVGDVFVPKKGLTGRLPAETQAPTRLKQNIRAGQMAAKDYQGVAPSPQAQHAKDIGAVSETHATIQRDLARRGKKAPGPGFMQREVEGAVSGALPTAAMIAASSVPVVGPIAVGTMLAGDVAERAKTEGVGRATAETAKGFLPSPDTLTSPEADVYGGQVGMESTDVAKLTEDAAKLYFAGKMGVDMGAAPVKALGRAGVKGLGLVKGAGKTLVEAAKEPGRKRAFMKTFDENMAKPPQKALGRGPIKGDVEYQYPAVIEGEGPRQVSTDFAVNPEGGARRVAMTREEILAARQGLKAKPRTEAPNEPPYVEPAPYGPTAPPPGEGVPHPDISKQLPPPNSEPVYGPRGQLIGYKPGRTHPDWKPEPKPVSGTVEPWPWLEENPMMPRRTPEAISTPQQAVQPTLPAEPPVTPGIDNAALNAALKGKKKSLGKRGTKGAVTPEALYNIAGYGGAGVAAAGYLASKSQNEKLQKAGQLAMGVGVPLALAGTAGRMKLRADPATNPANVQAGKLIRGPEVDVAAQKLMQAIKDNDVHAYRAEQTEAYKKSLKQKVAGLHGVKGKGEAGYQRGEAILHKPLGEATFSPIRNALEQADVDTLFNHVDTTPLISEKHVLQRRYVKNGLDKVLQGRPPEPKQLVEIERIFGPDMAGRILQAHPDTYGRSMKAVWEAAGIPRSIMTSWDVSAPFRQGAALTVGNPKATVQAWGDMMEAMLSEKGYTKVSQRLRENKHYEFVKKMGLEETERTLAGGLGKREESFPSRMAEAIPGVGPSERAYGTFLNAQRHYNAYDLMDRVGYTLKDPSAAKYLDPKYKPKGVVERIESHYARQAANRVGGTGRSDIDLMVAKQEAAEYWRYQQIFDYYNTATGRPKLPIFEKSSGELATIFFSPRYLYSRMILPKYLSPHYALVNPQVAKIAWANMGGYVALVGAVAAAVVARGGTVQKDPRSSDFMKMKIGNTRIDPWAGEQQLARYTAQFVMGQGVNQSGGTYEANRLSTAGRFARSKMAPLPGFAIDAMAGKTMVGDTVDWSKASLGKIAERNLVPMSIQDTGDALQLEGPARAALVAPLATTGFGVQTYEPKSYSGGGGSRKRRGRLR